MGVHFPNAAWTPSGLGVVPATWAGGAVRSCGAWGSFVSSVAPAGRIPRAHVGMATSYWLGGGFNTIQYNTDITGQGREYWRTPGYAVAVCRPLYDVESVPPPPAVGLPLSFEALCTRLPFRRSMANRDDLLPVTAEDGHYVYDV